ncbi:MAG: DUF6477 family protein [bacterium]
MSNHEPLPGGRIRAMRILIEKGAGRYERDRHLDRLLGGHADDPATAIARLKRALRSQRRLGRAGHWSYDLNRHFGLLQALKAELDRSRAHIAADAGANADASTASGTSDTGTETS